MYADANSDIKNEVFGASLQQKEKGYGEEATVSTEITY